MPGIVFPGCQLITGRFHSHPSLPGLLIARVDSPTELARANGVLYASTASPAFDTVVAATGGKMVHGFVGRSKNVAVQNSDAVTNRRGVSVTSGGPVTNSGQVVSITTYFAEVSQLNRVGYKYTVLDQYLDFKKTNASTGAIGTDVMGIVSSAQFGAVCDSPNPGVSGLGDIPSSTAAYETALPKIMGATALTTGYLGSNVAIGSIGDIIYRERYKLFDIDNAKIKSLMEAAVVQVAKKYQNVILYVPVGVVFKQGTGVPTFGLLTARPVSYGATAGSDMQSKTVTVGNTSPFSATEVVPGGNSTYVMPNELLPRSLGNVDVIPLAMTDVWKDMFHNMLVGYAITDVRPGARLSPTITWNGGYSLGEALAMWFNGFDPLARTITDYENRYTLAVKDQTVKPTPKVVYGQLNLYQSELTRSIFGGTLAKLVAAVDEVYKAIEDSI